MSILIKTSRLYTKKEEKENENYITRSLPRSIRNFEMSGF